MAAPVGLDGHAGETIADVATRHLGAHHGAMLKLAPTWALGRPWWSQPAHVSQGPAKSGLGPGSRLAQKGATFAAERPRSPFRPRAASAGSASIPQPIRAENAGPGDSRVQPASPVAKGAARTSPRPAGRPCRCGMKNGRARRGSEAQIAFRGYRVTHGPIGAITSPTAAADARSVSCSRGQNHRVRLPKGLADRLFPRGRPSLRCASACGPTTLQAISRHSCEFTSGPHIATFMPDGTAVHLPTSPLASSPT